MANLITAESPGVFFQMDHPQFRNWLKDQNLNTLEKALPTESDIMPRDLLAKIFDDDEKGLKVLLEDECGCTIKESTIERLRDSYAQAAAFQRPLQNAVAASSTSSNESCELGGNG